MAETVTSTSPDIKARTQVVTESANGAIGIKDGDVYITKGSAATMTLAAPIAGVDDGKSLTIVDSTGFAHTVTTPANGINTNKLTATFDATLARQFTLRAYGGTWWTNPGATGITLS